MRTAIALLTSILATLAACDQPQVALHIETDVPFDGGVRPCGTIGDLACVNFLLFELERGSDYLAHCVPVTRRLETLCDLEDAATGAALFEVAPDETIRLTVEGLRVYPATGCQSSECPERVLFSGTTGDVPATAGTTIELGISEVAGCGLPEEFYPRHPGESCEQVCGAGNVVCDAIEDGCLCTVLD